MNLNMRGNAKSALLQTIVLLSTQNLCVTSSNFQTGSAGASILLLNQLFSIFPGNISLMDFNDLMQRPDVKVDMNHDGDQKEKEVLLDGRTNVPSHCFPRLVSWQQNHFAY
ncbi:hypothetical protein SLE2022_195810 [Rubroshorea leprosula]